MSVTAAWCSPRRYGDGVVSNARGGTNLASNASIEWLAPARVGDRLVAEASETHHQGRTGVYGVVVSGPEGVVAVFHGKTKRISDEGRPR